MTSFNVLPVASFGEGTSPAGITFTVHGTPAPQGSKRHVGRGIMVESSKKVAPWREAIKWAVLQQFPNLTPMAGPVAVVAAFTLPKPASAAKRAYPSKRPDLDKILRSTFDGLGEAGVWLDDAQVVSVTATKSYPGETLPVPGVVITVWPVTG